MALNFQFLEGPLAHSALDTSLESFYRSKIDDPVQTDTVAEQVLLYERLVSTIRIRIPLVHLLRQGSKTRTPFTVIAQAVAHRSTSKAKDESLCMAGLMGFDVAAILQHNTAEERMMLFYTMLAEIPSDIILVTGMARLRTAPFRWAPASILTGEFASLKNRWRPARFCSAYGLYVICKGFIFGDLDEALSEQPRIRCIIQDHWTDVEYMVHKSTLEGQPETFILPRRPSIDLPDGKEKCSSRLG